MRIEGAPGEVLREVWLALTLEEARDLRDELNFLLSGETTEGWHAHILCEDGSTELTISQDLGHSASS